MSEQQTKVVPTVDDFVNAFKETGLTPRQGVTLGEECACALGAYFKHHKSAERGVAVFVMADTTFGTNFSDGVMAGFDGREPTYDNEEYKAGHKVGKEVWEKVKPNDEH